MYRLFVLLFFLLVTIPTLVEAAGPRGEAEIAFSRGLLSYNRKAYGEAEGRFEKAYRIDPSHRGAAFYLGMSCFRQEKYERAVEAFEMAVQLNPKDSEPYFYRALSLYRLGRREEALADFKEAAARAPEGGIREASSSYIRTLETKTQPALPERKRWFFNGHFSTHFDSNVSLNPEDITVATLPTDRSDIQIGLRAGGGYHVVDQENYRLTPEISYTQTIYPELISLSYGLSHAEIRNQFRFGHWGLTLPAAYEFALLGSSKFMQNVQSAPVLSYLAGNRFLTSLSPRVRYDIFSQTITNPAQDRDALNLHSEFSESVYFSQKRGFVRVFYQFENNWAQGADWDYRGHTVGAALLSPIAWKVSAFVYAGVTIDKQFQNVDSVLGIKRDDTLQNYGLSLSRPVTDFMTVSANYNFRHNSSSIPFFEYNKHLAGVTFAFHL